MQYKQESEYLWRSENRKIDRKIQSNDKEKTSSVSHLKMNLIINNFEFALVIFDIWPS